MCTFEPSTQSAAQPKMIFPSLSYLLFLFFFFKKEAWVVKSLTYHLSHKKKANIQEVKQNKQMLSNSFALPSNLT